MVNPPLLKKQYECVYIDYKREKENLNILCPRCKKRRLTCRKGGLRCRIGYWNFDKIQHFLVIGAVVHMDIHIFCG
jgi:hypothetical protein